MLEHVGRSAAVRRALETGVVLRVARAVHETQRERGLISTYVASDGRARALELGRQFLRTDAAMDLAVRGSVMNQRPRHRCDDGGCSIITLDVTQVGAVLKHADTSKPRGIDTDLSPKRTAARLGAAVDLAARRSAYVLSDEPRGSPPPGFAPWRPRRAGAAARAARSSELYCGSARTRRTTGPRRPRGARRARRTATSSTSTRQ